MAPDPRQRASDADRDAVAAELREAFAEGRLTQDEFEARLDQVHAARTYGDLSPITADLPAPTTPVPAVRDDAVARRSRTLRAGWASWLGVAVMVNIIWFASWAAGGESPSYYWPIWVMGPWGAAMVIATLSQRARGDDP